MICPFRVSSNSTDCSVLVEPSFSELRYAISDMEKKATFIVVIVLNCILLALLVQPVQVQLSREILERKLWGEAPHASWLEVVSVFIPSKLRPSWMPNLVHPEEYFRTPVYAKKREEQHTLWETSLGDFWAPSNEQGVLAHLINEVANRRVYDKPPVAVEPGDVVIDGGAHIGVFSRFAFRRGAQKVVAVDPDPRNLEYLRRNFAEELREGRFILVQKALWDRVGPLKLSLDPLSARNRVFEPEGGSENSVPGTTIDELVKEYGLHTVDFIKLDIEGAEAPAIAGAQLTLSQFLPRMAVCTYHKSDDPVMITAKVIRLQPEYSVFATREQAYFYPPGE